MTEEQKWLLLKDLCARLPYGVICKVFLDINNHIINESDKYSDSQLETINCQLKTCTFKHLIGYSFGKFPIEHIKPYLRPMSSMTEEEKDEYDRLVMCNASWVVDDWLNKNQFDYRGLIPMELALEAKEGMYKNK